MAAKVKETTAGIYFDPTHPVWAEAGWLKQEIDPDYVGTPENAVKGRCNCKE